MESYARKARQSCSFFPHCISSEGKKKFVQAENSPPPPHHFSNGPSLMCRLYVQKLIGRGIEKVFFSSVQSSTVYAAIYQQIGFIAFWRIYNDNYSLNP